MLELEIPTRFMDPEEFKYASGHLRELTGIGIQIAQDEKTKKDCNCAD